LIRKSSIEKFPDGSMWWDKENALALSKEKIRSMIEFVRNDLMLGNIHSRFEFGDTVVIGLVFREGMMIDVFCSNGHFSFEDHITPSKKHLDLLKQMPKYPHGWGEK
jgi:hypothetical protein